ncbi:MAG TPA: hypothetical protein VMJ35_01650 [Dongiaceae bacterium]|nr:hypothetical protein [Dongiaceae bacterium]
MRITLTALHVTVKSSLVWLLWGMLPFAPAGLWAQQPAGAGTSKTSLPDSPQPKPQGETNPATSAASRFIGYALNRSIVFPDIATKPEPLSPGGKFKLFVNQSISPAYILAAATNAAYSQARNSPSAYGQGWDAYGGRFGAALARSSSNAFFSSFLIASMVHDDPRFFPQNRPTFWGSVKYSAARLFVTRKDSGRNAFNTSGIVGTLAAETLANAYLPVSEQTGAKTAERFGTDLAWRFAGNMFKNYWPTIFRSMNLQRLKVIPDPGAPNQPSQ